MHLVPEEEIDHPCIPLKELFDLKGNQKLLRETGALT